MKLLQIFVATLVAMSAHIHASQQKQIPKRHAETSVQSLDIRPTNRTTTTTSSAQSLDEGDVKMECAEQPRTRSIATQTDLQMVGNQIISHEKDEDLLQAAREGNLQQIQALFDPRKSYIPDINARDPQPIDPEDDSLQSVLSRYEELKKEKSEDIYIVGRMDGMTPLMMAADNGDIEIARFLIEHGADLNMQTIGGMTALNIALEDKDYKWEQPYSNTHLIQRMSRSVDMPFPGPVPIAQMLIEAGADVDKKGAPISPLKSALYWQKEDIIKLLVEHGAHGTLKTLLDADVENNEMEDRVLLLFIKNGMDIHESDTDNWTPLRWAIIGARANLVRDLLSQGANPYIRDSNGQNAFELALLEEREQNDEASHKIVKLLDNYKKLQTPEHIKALQAVAQKVMEHFPKSARTVGMGQHAQLVQQFLRPSYRQEAENKEKEEKEKKEGSEVAHMVDEG